MSARCDNLLGQNLNNTLLAFSAADCCMKSKGYQRVKTSEFAR
jgi:hypothetical protein